MLRALRRVSAASAVAGGGYATYLYQTDEGSRRALVAYATFAPVVMHYRFVDAKQRYTKPTDSDAEREWRALDAYYAKSTVAKLGELQGMFTKYGQTVAGLGSTLSDIWIQELRKLEDRVPPRSAEVVHRTIFEETGKSADEIFSSFDDEPLGSASIGQVHRAVLRSTGQQVAVKVQYPEASLLFRQDMATIRSFFQTFAPEQLFQLEALEKQNAAELDYTLEAEHLREVGANMHRHGFMPSEVVVPQPVVSLSTPRVLVMDMIPGPKLIDGLRAYGRVVAAEQGTTLEALETEMKAKIEAEGAPPKYDGPSASAVATYLRWMRARDGVINVCLAVYNGCLGRWVGKRAAYVETTLPPNAPRVMDVLMRVHGQQLFCDGVFNADPHGGNFLMLPDDRIGLIDYGATKRLTYNERLSVCVMFAALYKKDEKVMQEMAQVGGYKSKYGKKEIIMKLMQFAYDSYGPEVTGGKNIVQFVDELKAEDPWEEVPDNFVMVQFLTVRLRGLAMAMNHPIVCSEWWGPIALEVLKAEGLPYETWDRAQLEKYKPELNMQVNKFG